MRGCVCVTWDHSKRVLSQLLLLFCRASVHPAVSYTHLDVYKRQTLYEARGDYQLVFDHLEEAGEGALRRAFEALQARLAAEGLFDATRKRPLPTWVRRVAVITSPTGAAVRDVLSVLARRLPLLCLLYTSRCV